MGTSHDLGFGASSRPKILPSATLTQQNDAVELVIGEQNYTFKGPSAETLQQSYSSLDGMNTIDEIVANTAADKTVLYALLDYLSNENLVIDIQAPQTQGLSGRQLVNIILKEAVFWRQHIHAQPCWQQMSKGQLSDRQILGWGIEFYHYVEAANEYMASGVAFCRESIDIRQKLARQYADEADHGIIFLNGLVADGLKGEHLMVAPPLPSTRALINFLIEASIDSTLVYSVVFALMQSDGEKMNATDLTDYYYGLGKTYPKAKGMFDAFLKHALIDAQLAHQTSLFEDIYATDEIMSVREANSVVDTVRTLKNYFILFYEGMFNYYAEEDSQLPRRPSRVTDLLS